MRSMRTETQRALCESMIPPRTRRSIQQQKVGSRKAADGDAEGEQLGCHRGIVMMVAVPERIELRGGGQEDEQAEDLQGRPSTAAASPVQKSSRARRPPFHLDCPPSVEALVAQRVKQKSECSISEDKKAAGHARTASESWTADGGRDGAKTDITSLIEYSLFVRAKTEELMKSSTGSRKDEDRHQTTDDTDQIKWEKQSSTEGDERVPSCADEGKGEKDGTRGLT